MTAILHLCGVSNPLNRRFTTRNLTALKYLLYLPCPAVCWAFQTEHGYPANFKVFRRGTIRLSGCAVNRRGKVRSEVRMTVVEWSQVSQVMMWWWGEREKERESGAVDANGLGTIEFGNFCNEPG